VEKQPVNKNKKLNPVQVTIIAIFATPLILVLFLLIGALINMVKQPSNPLVYTQQAESKPPFEVLSSSMKNEEYTKYVTGRIQNNTSKIFSYVQVEINLYDINDKFIGSTLDNVNNFEGGTVWYFKAIVIDDIVKKFKIMDISWRE
jgi:hypothetical protein